MKESTRQSRVKGTGRAIADHQSTFPHPLVIQAGEELQVGQRDTRWSGWIWCTSQKGHSGWVPEQYIGKEGSVCRANRHYDATELTVKAGDRLVVDGEESGWLWCADERGNRGWVPAEKVEIASRDSRPEHRESGCEFCDISAERIVRQNELACAVRDSFPVTSGHTLVIPRRHISSYFELEPSEVAACHRLLVEMRNEILSAEGEIEGFNIGINQGAAAGQTIFHCHIHLIPRRDGDVENARGGIRHVIPGKGCY